MDTNTSYISNSSLFHEIETKYNSSEDTDEEVEKTKSQFEQLNLLKKLKKKKAKIPLKLNYQEKNPFDHPSLNEIMYRLDHNRSIGIAKNNKVKTLKVDWFLVFRALFKEYFHFLKYRKAYKDVKYAIVKEEFFLRMKKLTNKLTGNYNDGFFMENMDDAELAILTNKKSLSLPDKSSSTEPIENILNYPDITPENNGNAIAKFAGKFNEQINVLINSKNALEYNKFLLKIGSDPSLSPKSPKTTRVRNRNSTKKLTIIKESNSNSNTNTNPNNPSSNLRKVKDVPQPKEIDKTIDLNNANTDPKSKTNILFGNKFNSNDAKLRAKMEFLKKNKFYFQNLLNHKKSDGRREDLKSLASNVKAYQYVIDQETDVNSYNYIKPHYTDLKEDNDKFEEFKKCKKFNIKDDIINEAIRLNDLAEEIMEFDKTKE